MTLQTNSSGSEN